MERRDKEHCSYCGFVYYEILNRTLSNGESRLYARCLDCGRWIRALPEEISGSQEDFVMPFGKHKGKTLLFISQADPDYLLWAEENFEKGKNIHRRIVAFLDYKKSQFNEGCDFYDKAGGIK